MNQVACTLYTVGLGTIASITALVGIYLAGAGWFMERLRPAARSTGASLLRISRIPAVRLFLLTSLILTGIRYALLAYWTHLYARNPGSWYLGVYPYDSPYLQFNCFWDLRVYQDRMPFLHTLHFFEPMLPFPWQYPPAIALLFVPLLWSHPSVGFLLVVIPLMTALVLKLARRLIVEGLTALQAYGLVIATLLISYPFWFEINQGNTEILIFFLIVGGLRCFSKRNFYASAVLLGLATGIKIFPGVYFGLMLARKQYKQIVVGLVTAFLSNLAGLWILAPKLKLAYQQVQAGLAYNREHYMLTWLAQETSFDHSGFGLVKQAVKAVYNIDVMPPQLLSSYMLVVALAGLAIYFLRIRKLPFVNQVAALCVASILLPPTSHDYTLIHLYIPWAMLAVIAVRAAKLKQRVPGLVSAMLCFSILMSSESELMHKNVSYAGQIKCVVLVILLVIILRFRWTGGDQQEADGITTPSPDFAGSPSRAHAALSPMRSTRLAEPQS